MSDQDAQDTLRQSRLTEQLAQILAVNRGFRRQLQDHRAAGEQRRKELRQSDLMWRVPRDDSGDQAYRVTDPNCVTPGIASAMHFPRIPLGGNQIGLALITNEVWMALANQAGAPISAVTKPANSSERVS